MITASHMRMLQAELEELRDRMRRGHGSAEEVQTLRRMAEKMHTDGRDGSYEKALSQVLDLLDSVLNGEYERERLRDAFEQLQEG